MELTTTEKNWYAIFTKPKAEKKVLERFEEADIEAFLPMIKTVRQWSDRKKTLRLPLIPSYVFVCLPEKEVNKTLPIHGTVAVLKHLGKPAKIRPEEIENLRILSINGNAENIENCSRPVEGDAVLVNKGPFMGLIGTCLKDGNKNRVVIRLDSLGSCFSVEVPLSFIEVLKRAELQKA